MNNLTEAEGDVPSPVSGTQPSPTAQLAAFSPFPPNSGSSQTTDTGTLNFRNQDPFGAWSLISATDLQLAESAPPAAETSFIDPSGFLNRPLLNATPHTVAAYAGPPQAGPTNFTAADNVQGNWVGPISNGSALESQRPSVSQAYGRRFVVRNVSTDIEGLSILRTLRGFQGMNGPHMADLNTKGRFYVSFPDLREAQRFVQWIEHFQPEWEIVPMRPDDFARETHSSVPLPRNFDDLILVTIYCGGHSTAQGLEIVAAVRPILDLVGSVHSVQEIQFGAHSRVNRIIVHEMTVRFYDTNQAINAVNTLNGIRTEDFVMEAIPYSPYNGGRPVRHWQAPSASIGRNPRFTPPPGYMSPGADPDSPPFSTGNPQAIDLRKIYWNHDMRTTVMLRNIPFTMTWVELKDILDATNANRFDFLYLRMEFEQNKNVGYAFVNFVDPKEIITFMEAREGRNWPGYPATRTENKIAEMSYATLQGRDALVQKFRNSPVILSPFDKRPKIFHVSGPRSGQEAAFPPVNDFETLAKGVISTRRNGLYRGPPVPPRSDPRTGTRYNGYSDNMGTPMQNGYARDFGSPVRASRVPYDPSSTPRTALQQWNLMHHEPRTH